MQGIPARSRQETKSMKKRKRRRKRGWRYNIRFHLTITGTRTTSITKLSVWTRGTNVRTPCLLVIYVEHTIPGRYYKEHDDRKRCSNNRNNRKHKRKHMFLRERPTTIIIIASWKISLSKRIKTVHHLFKGDALGVTSTSLEAYNNDEKIPAEHNSVWNACYIQDGAEQRPQIKAVTFLRAFCFCNSELFDLSKIRIPPMCVCHTAYLSPPRSWYNVFRIHLQTQVFGACLGRPIGPGIYSSVEAVFYSISICMYCFPTLFQYNNANRPQHEMRQSSTK